jgi:hypothetical protein
MLYSTFSCLGFLRGRGAVSVLWDFNQSGARLDHLADIMTAVTCDLHFVSGVFTVVRAILFVGHALARRVSAFLNVRHGVSPYRV